MLWQPPQSPDTNVLDLAAFHGLETRVDKINRNRRSVNGLLKCVQKAWTDMEPDILRRAFASRARVMRKIVEVGGDNGFKIPRALSE